MNNAFFLATVVLIVSLGSSLSLFANSDGLAIRGVTAAILAVSAAVSFYSLSKAEKTQKAVAAES
jgi:hypothetical protein